MQCLPDTTFARGSEGNSFATARGTFVNSFPSPVKYLFCTDRIESIEWQDLVPRLRTGDCILIHIPH